MCIRDRYKVFKDILKCRWILLAKAGNGFMIRGKFLKQPNHFEVSFGLNFQTPGRTHVIHIAINIKF